VVLVDPFLSIQNSLWLASQCSIKSFSIIMLDKRLKWIKLFSHLFE